MATGSVVVFSAAVALIIVLITNEVAQRAFGCTDNKAGVISLTLGVVSWVSMTTLLIGRG